MQNPLSDFALDALRTLARTSRPSQEFNPGVVNKLLREGLVVVQSRPSPYATGRGQPIGFLLITAAGRARVAL